MHFSEFATIHERTPDTLQFDNPVLQELEQRAFDYGENMLDYLRGRTPLSTVASAAIGYAKDAGRHWGELYKLVSPDQLQNQESPTPQHGAVSSHMIHGTTAIHFACQNIHASLPTTAVQNIHNLSQILTAAAGVRLHRERQKLAEDKFSVPDRPYRYFSPHYSAYRRWAVGIGNEIDTALVLQEIVRRNPGIVFLPAPPQFERGAPNEHSQRNPNIDFLVLHPKTEKIIGAQVKTHVTQDIVDKYDEQSVVLISGNEDLGNTLAVRTQPQSSDTHTWSWPGLISLQRLKELADSPRYKSLDPKPRLAVLNQVRDARLHAPKSGTQFRTSLRIISDRILPKLDVEETDQPVRGTQKQAPRRTGTNRKRR